VTLTQNFSVEFFKTDLTSICSQTVTAVVLVVALFHAILSYKENISYDFSSSPVKGVEHCTPTSCHLAYGS
jgi:hypothetical protein